jgi:hypothetical protein
MTAFNQAWRLFKADDFIYYNVHVTPRTTEEADRLYGFESQLASEGITYDSGGMVGKGGGRDMHLDFSLRGATPDQVLQRLADTGIPYELEMIASDIPKHGTQERLDYDRKDMKEHDEWLTQETGQTHMDGKPYSEAEGIGEYPCPSCAEEQAQYPDEYPKEGNYATIIREGMQDNHRISLNCPHCGHMDMDWGEDNPQWKADGQ